jgi:hypothetical protein
VPEIVFMPTDNPLPEISGTQSYQVTSLQTAIDFIDYFTQTSGHAVESEGTVVWTYGDDSIVVSMDDFLVTDQTGHVWMMDTDNFGMWLNGV